MKIPNPTSFRENVRVKLNKIIRKKKLSLNLEKGIFNYSIQTAKQKNIVRKWDNAAFVLIYIDKLRSIILNLNTKSTVQNKQLLKITTNQLLESILKKKIVQLIFGSYQKIKKSLE